MPEIIPLAFEEHLVRTILRAGEPWFVGKDVCQVLGLSNHNKALGTLDEDERAGVTISDPSGTKRAIAVSESGVYRLVFRSRKPEAERFKRWPAHPLRCHPVACPRDPFHRRRPAIGKQHHRAARRTCPRAGARWIPVTRTGMTVERAAIRSRRCSRRRRS